MAEVEVRLMVDGGVGAVAGALLRSHYWYWLGGEGLVGWDWCCTIGAVVVVAGGDVVVGVGGDADVGADAGGGGDVGGATLDGIAGCVLLFLNTDGSQRRQQVGIACAAVADRYPPVGRSSWDDYCNDDGDGAIRWSTVVWPRLPFLDRCSSVCCRSIRIGTTTARTLGGIAIT